MQIVQYQRSGSMNKEDVKHIIVHCAYTPRTMDIGVKDIDRWHRAKGWLGCGYHLVIRRDGTLEYGRPLTRTGAHVRSQNKTSIGICLIGGMNADKTGAQINYTDDQYATLKLTIDELIWEHFPDAKVRGHIDFDKGKTCPNFDAELWYNTGEIVSTIN